MKMIGFLKKYKITIIVVMVIITFMSTAIMANASSYDISDIPDSIREHLEKSFFLNFITMAMRSIGYMLYKFLGMILDLVQSGFMLLAKWDVFSLKPLQVLDLNLKDLIYACIPIALLISVFIKIFKLENSLKVIYNSILTMLCIAVFLGLMGIGFNLKNNMLDEISSLVGIRENETLSQTLFKSNTVDLKKSIETGRLYYLSDYGSFDLSGFDEGATIDKDFLGTKLSTNTNGVATSSDLIDGIGGVGDERYYSYKTDYYSLNCTLFATAIINLFAIYKLAYVVGEWIKIKTTGSLFMLKGFNDVSNVGKIYKSGANNLVSICILYFGMMFFTIVSQAIISENAFDNWLINVLVIVAIGMSLLAGSGYFNDALGVDDGSGFLMKSVFLGRSINRMGKHAMHGASNIAKMGYGAMAQGVDTASKAMSNSVHANDFRRANEQGERDTYVQNRMEDYQKNANEQKLLENKNKIDYDDRNKRLLEDQYSSDGRITPMQDDQVYGTTDDGSIVPLGNRQLDKWKANLKDGSGYDDNTGYRNIKTSGGNSLNNDNFSSNNNGNLFSGTSFDGGSSFNGRTIKKPNTTSNSGIPTHSNNDKYGKINRNATSNMIVPKNNDSLGNKIDKTMMNQTDDNFSQSDTKGINEETRAKRREDYLFNSDAQSKINQVSENVDLGYNGKNISLPVSAYDKVKSEYDFYDMLKSDYKDVNLNNGEKAELYSQFKKGKDTQPTKVERMEKGLQEMRDWLNHDLDGYVAPDPLDDPWFQSNHSRENIDDNFRKNERHRKVAKK